VRECVIVKTLRNNKVQSSTFFNDYMKALDFAESECWKGFYCIVLRKYAEKKWAKAYLIPPETL